VPVERLDLARLARLDFETPDPARFPALGLARRVMETRGLSGAAFNAAKEVALDGFIAGRLRFLQMAAVVEDVLDLVSRDCGLANAVPALEEVQAMDHLARQAAAERVAARSA
jgi:1-deoxy-D-xylulose-5-phosphate reductoisomerase